MKNSSLSDGGPTSDEQQAPERWTVDGDDPANLHVVVAGAPHLRVCFLTSNGPTEARARLIAAAPELLRQLQYALDNIEGIMNGNDLPSTAILRHGREAIAKATREPDTRGEAR